MEAMIKAITNLVKALGANTNPGEIAHAASCGLLLGLMPKNNVLWYLVLVFILFLRINKPAYVLMLFAGTVVAPAFDGIFDAVGYWFLTLPAFSDFFAAAIEVPFVAFTKFNNTIVAGSLLCGLAAYIPLYICIRLFLSLWRKCVVPFLRKSFISKLVRKLPLVSKITGFLGED